MAHAHADADYNRAFALGVALNTAFVLTEVYFGNHAHSLALLADAGHNFGDVLGLLVAWGASRMVRQSPTARRTYGLRRSSILAAALNASLLLIAVGVIGWVAIDRLFHPGAVGGGTVILVAAAGVVINTFTALLFMSGRKHDLNVRGAFLHMAADAAVSLGVVVAGIVIYFTGWVWVDPAISLLIAVVITVGAWDILRRSVALSLDAVPDRIDPSSVRAFLCGLPGVVEVHDLHIWAMSTTETALTVHLVRPGTRVDDDWLERVNEELHERFHIEHATIQIESGEGSHPCRLAPEHVV